MPLIVRSSSDSKYEIISGHRRFEACKSLGLEKVPVIIRNMSDDEAVMAMVDANLQRESILPSEKAFAYKMKMEALKCQGKRVDLETSSQNAEKFRTDDKIASTLGISGDTLQRYIRLTYLIPELLKMVDEKRIAFNPAVELSFLSENEQKILYSEIEYSDATPSLSQAQRLRNFSRQGRLSADTVYAVMSEEKANQKEQVRLAKEDIQRYFPKNYTGQDMHEVILKLLEKWQRQRKSREER